jgi:hypothetical protein
LPAYLVGNLTDLFVHLRRDRFGPVHPIELTRKCRVQRRHFKPILSYVVWSRDLALNRQWRPCWSGLDSYRPRRLFRYGRCGRHCEYEMLCVGNLLLTSVRVFLAIQGADPFREDHHYVPFLAENRSIVSIGGNSDYRMRGLREVGRSECLRALFRGSLHVRRS